MGKKFKIGLDVFKWVVAAGIVVVTLLRGSIFPQGSLLASLYDAQVADQIGVRLIKTGIIVVVCIAIINLSGYIVNASLHIKNNKSKTFLMLIGNVLKYLSAILMVLLILSAWGVDTTVLVTSAGVLTLIVGLGCQSLVADIVAGVFILFEGDFKVGDVVVISGWRGTVQSIGLRTTKIIDAVGNVKIINNSSISDIINNTKELSVAICDLAIDYNESIERVENVIKNNLDEIKQHIPSIVDGPFYKGVASLGESGILLRLVAQCKEEDKYQTERDLNREMKLICDKNKIDIPFNQIVVSYREENDGITQVSKKVKEEAREFQTNQKELSKGIEQDENQ